MTSLALLQLEDPTFKVKLDKDTAQTVMSGMGTLHLEVKRHRLERDFRLKVRVGKPNVSYREKLVSGKTVEVVVDRMGDKQVFAKLRVSFTNFKVDRPVIVTNSVGPEALPALFAAAAERGLTDALQTGELGFPMMHVQANITDAKFDPNLSSEDAFLKAASQAYRDAIAGNIQLMEPIMRVTVTTPNEFLGNVIGDLTQRRGVIERQEALGAGDTFEVEAFVPLRLLFDYADRVRSLSQGRAASGLEPHSYEPAPAEVRREMLGE